MCTSMPLLQVALNTGARWDTGKAFKKHCLAYHMLKKKITSILYKFSENEAGMGGDYYPSC